MSSKTKLSRSKQRQIENLSNEAMHFFIAGKQALADQSCRKIVAIDPFDPNANNLLGKITEKKGDLPGAQSLYLHAIKQHPKHPGLIASLALLSAKLNDGKSAINYWLQLAKLEPKNPTVWQAVSAQWSEMHQWDRAELAAGKALDYAPNSAPLHANMGFILLKLHRHQEAIQHLAKVLKISPGDINICFELARATLEVGNFDEAMDLFYKVLERNPNHEFALFMLLRYQQPENSTELIKRAQTLLDNAPQHSGDGGLLAFALGKIYEDQKDYDNAFAYYDKANTIQRKTITYDMNEDHRYAEKIKQTFSKKNLSSYNVNADSGEQYLFIIGMPRCGSTLLDSILSAHPSIVDTGESETFNDLACYISGAEDTKQVLMEHILDLPQEQLEAAAKEYSGTIQRFFGKSDKYIDKRLPNFLLAGLIHMIFPKAKILHISRDPLDTCFSIFATPFEGPEFNFAYSLEEIGQYYGLYRNMMAHWRDVLPADCLYEISYESLVASPEEETRKLLNFCELEWNERCLSYYKSKLPVRTASLAQVRQPIYNHSIGRWKQFKNHLQPLVDILPKSCNGSHT